MTVIPAERPLAHEGLQEPLPPPLERLLKQAALDHAANDVRRVFTPQLHVGVPGAPHPVIAADLAETDATLRTDAVAAMLSRATRQSGAARTLVWLVRPDEADDGTLDNAWLSAARAAYAEAEQPLVFVVIDRHGWHDPRSGLGRRWLRLRDR